MGQWIRWVVIVVSSMGLLGGCSASPGGGGGGDGDRPYPSDAGDPGDDPPTDDPGDTPGDTQGDAGAGTDGAPPATSETCGDGRDDDADGRVDEECGCEPGITQECYGGPREAAGVGECAIGSQSCEPAGEFGTWGECTGWTGPSEEACNGVDDDCDGEVDEGCGCTPGETRSCYEHPDGTPGEGTPGVGICAEGTETCEELPGGGSDWSDCSGATFPLPEVCDNGMDDDCDGEVDEGCTPPGDVDCTMADVLFLVDTTGSMGGEIGQIQSKLRDTIIPGLASEIGDAQFSVARFDDFPVGGYGSGSDVPFELVQASTASEMAAQSAVDTLFASGGSDGPESQVEALYQTATGDGIGTWVPAASCGAGTEGYPCFRSGATHIVLLFTDNEFHNGPGGANPYSGVAPSPHDYTQAVTELSGIGAKVLGLYSGGSFSSGRSHLESIARDTGALASDGSPIVIDIGTDGSGLDSGVIEAVASLCAD